MTTTSVHVLPIARRTMYPVRRVGATLWVFQRVAASARCATHDQPCRAAAAAVS
jgi:hypothetical protein